MTARQTVGAGLLLAVFGGLFVAIGLRDDWLTAVTVYALALATMALIHVGVHLLFGGDR